ncbi:hypothetical protein [Ligilactobacillus saerimneri]|uniref:hypothetical protein n=1 Tax=Ligilactobacillus saerimneri TaxID=228229 RepID=UPI002942C559|nr:hypothetical protein [Ligilactobacillus saerimneri]
MSLLDAYKKATEGWDAKNDSAQQRDQGLPAGDYDVILDSVSHATYQSGYECLRFVMTVYQGEYTGRKEFINVSLAEKTKDGRPMPDFVVSQNIRYIAKVGTLVGLDVKPKHFDGVETDLYENFNQMFRPCVGKSLKMTVILRPNKDKTKDPYRSYDFAPGETISTPDPVAADPEVTDDDLPF